ncbi:hypothetical protein [Rhodanobacter lindaniclasticus]
MALQPGFAAVRTLTMAQCLANADSWAFFCADAAGALGERDRIAALGKLYDDTGWTATQKVGRKLANQWQACSRHCGCVHRFGRGRGLRRQWQGKHHDAYHRTQRQLRAAAARAPCSSCVMPIPSR